MATTSSPWPTTPALGTSPTAQTSQTWTLVRHKTETHTHTHTHSLTNTHTHTTKQKHAHTLLRPPALWVAVFPYSYFCCFACCFICVQVLPVSRGRSPIRLKAGWPSRRA